MGEPRITPIRGEAMSKADQTEAVPIPVDAKTILLCELRVDSRDAQNPAHSAFFGLEYDWAGDGTWVAGPRRQWHGDLRNEPERPDEDPNAEEHPTVSVDAANRRGGVVRGAVYNPTAGLRWEVALVDQTTKEEVTGIGSR